MINGFKQISRRGVSLKIFPVNTDDRPECTNGLIQHGFRLLNAGHCHVHIRVILKGNSDYVFKCQGTGGSHHLFGGFRWRSPYRRGKRCRHCLRLIIRLFDLLIFIPTIVFTGWHRKKQCHHYKTDDGRQMTDGCPPSSALRPPSSVICHLSWPPWPGSCLPAANWSEDRQCSCKGPDTPQESPENPCW